MAIKLILPDLHMGQVEMCRPRPSKFNVNVCGTKAGKTLGFAIKMVSMAFDPHLRGKDFAWLAPFRDTAKIGMKYFLQLIPAPLREVNKADLTITILHNGNTIHFRGVNKDPENTIEGNAFHHIMLDEASKMPEQAIISARTTTTATRGQIDIFTTPRGKNWVYKYYLRGMDPHDSDYSAIRYPTSCNPYIAESEILLAKKQLPMRLFQQYYLAEFVDDSDVFTGFNQCIDTGPLIEQDDYVMRWIKDGAKDLDTIVVGVDWAKKEDWTVFTAWNYVKGELVGFCRFQGINYVKAVKILYWFCSKFEDTQLVYHDATGVGDAIGDILDKTDLNFEGILFTNKSKSEMVNDLILAIQKKACKLPNWHEMKSELDAYEVTTTSLGAFKYQASSGMHDDIVSSMILGWAAVLEFNDSAMDVKVLEDLTEDEISDVDDWATEIEAEFS